MAARRETAIETASAGTGDWRTPHARDYDLVILGGGSAGLSAADLALVLGVRVALVDRERLGGECLYTGCVPSKALLHVARVAHDVRWAHTLGLSAHLDPVDLGAVADQVRRVIGRVEQRDSAAAYARRGVEVLFGEARFTSPRELAINGTTVRAKTFLLATGSHATPAAIPGLEAAGYLTNDSIFDLRQLAARLTVVGGGPIGVELAQAFARLGSQVTILQRPDRLLPREDPEASAVLRHQLEVEGVTVETNAAITRFAVRDGAKVATVRAPDGTTRDVAADEVLVALGRTPNVAELGLEAAGVTFDPAKGVAVDRYLRTSNPRVFAAGDVRGVPYFTHAAAQQARLAVRNALTPSRARLDERALPRATFTDPEVARVGLTESDARRRYGAEVRTYTTPFSEVDRADTDEATPGFVKLVVRGKGELLGAHIVGRNAGEYINELALAMAAHIPLATIAATVHVYPTLALAIQSAAGEYALARVRAGATPSIVRQYLRLFR